MRERERLMDWVLRRVAEGWDGCLTGDCPHDNQDDCVAALLGRFDEDEAELNLPRSDEPLPDLDSLPELTDEDRAALDAVDLTESLGTWKERAEVAERAALRWFRDLRTARAEIQRLNGELRAARRGGEAAT